MRDAMQWAGDLFGSARLGNALRTRRLVHLAHEAARRPSGIVSEACSSSASREGAFRLLENPSVRPDDVAAPVFASTLRDCAGEDIVLVPVDGSSLTFADDARAKDLGGIGAWNLGARGIQTMSALAVTRDGAPIGLCGQRMWVREKRSKASPHEGPSDRSESRFWLELVGEVQRSFADEAPQTRPWFQMDRGADAWPVFKLATELDALITVRAVYDRRLEGGARLWSTVQRAPRVAKKRIELPARPPGRRKKLVDGKRISFFTKPRAARKITVTIRATTVTLDLSTKPGAPDNVSINVVLVRENSRRDERIEWMLLTTHPIRTKRDVMAVVDAYAMRWRIEDFHRAWKGGLCRVEQTQLRSRNGIFKWATILAAVATRAMRLTHLARKTPDALASTEFSSVELQALLALRQPKNVDESVISTLSLAQAVRWVADIGGYNGPWKGPPGPTVIGRGLYDVLVTARAFEYRDKTR
jgi:hypothetical protein